MESNGVLEAFWKEQGGSRQGRPSGNGNVNVKYLGERWLKVTPWANVQ